MSNWIGVPASIEDWLGFVYLITAPSGRMYVGKKMFWSNVKCKPLKGQTRNRRVRKESDWRKYFGSSNELQAELRRTDPADWRREILHLCESKWELAYVELKEQLARDALFRPEYFNSIIHVRLNQPPASFVARMSPVEAAAHCRTRTRGGLAQGSPNIPEQGDGCRVRVRRPRRAGTP